MTTELRTDLRLKLLYTGDSILVADSKESLCEKIVSWKSGLEAKV